MSALARMKARCAFAALLAAAMVGYVADAHGPRRVLFVIGLACWLFVLAAEAAEFVKRTERKS